MGATTGIQWTDATWNPVGGCSIKSPGCTNCYAQSLAGTRLAQLPLYAGTTSPSKAGPVFNGHLTRAADDAAVWTWPLRWRGSKNPRLGAGKPSMIFVGDMADLFHEDRPDADIDRAFAVMSLCPHHVFQVLTKRPNRMRRWFAADEERKEGIRAGRLAFTKTRLWLPEWPLRNVWMGVSVEDQKRADERRDDLARLAAAGWPTFVSYEPALGPVDWTGWEFLKQLISGGESGPRARPSHPDWHRASRDFAGAHDIAYFFKQWGEWAPHKIVAGGDLGGDVRAGRVRIVHPTGEDDVSVSMRTGGHNTIPGSRYMARVGKKAAGRLLDGIEHNGFPA